MSNICIIGSEGVVGGALKFGFELLGHNVFCHDLKLNTKLSEQLYNGNEFCFVCVPTPKNIDDSCNISIVEKILEEINKLQYSGIIIIKSTVSIGTTDKLINKYLDSNICFSPEFLKERSSIIDFTERQDLCIIGTYDDTIFNRVKKIHGHLPKKVIQLTPSEAEAAKYFNNALGATLVTFANSFYELCIKYNINYSNIKNAISYREFIPKSYLEVNPQWRGWAGVCWSKDLPAINYMLKNTNVEFFQNLIEENDKYTKTIPSGMRIR